MTLNPKSPKVAGPLPAETAKSGGIAQPNMLKGFAPPSWASAPSKADLIKLLDSDMDSVLRGLAGRTLSDEAAYQKAYRGKNLPTPNQGRIFLDSLNHLPLDLKQKKRVVQAALASNVLPRLLQLSVALVAKPIGWATDKDIQKAQEAVKKDQLFAGQAADFGEAIGERLVSTAVSIYKLAKYVSDMQPIMVMINPVGYVKNSAQAVITIKTTLKALKENPRLIWDAMTKDTKEAWQQGQYGKSLGYVTFDVGTLLLGGEGALSKAGLVVDITKVGASNVSVRVSQIGDDLLRGMDTGRLNPAFATAGAAAKETKPAGQVAGMAAQNPKPLTPAQGVSASTAARMTGSVQGGAVLADPLTVSGTARQLNLAQRCDNWEMVKDFIGKPASEATLPKGYKLARLPQKDGSFEVFAYLPESTKGYVPKLKMDANKVWQPDGLRWVKNSKTGKYGLQREYRLADERLYSANNPPPEGFSGTGAVNNHHLIPDEVMRASPIFQELFRRGLLSPDRASNMLNLAVNKQILAELKSAGFEMSDITHYTKHPRYTQHIQEFLDIKLNELSDKGILPKDLTKADPQQLLKVVSGWDAEIKNMFFRDADMIKHLLRGNGSLGELRQNNTTSEEA